MIEKIATLQELESTWSLDDVAKANAMLDMKADIMEANSNAGKGTTV